MKKIFFSVITLVLLLVTAGFFYSFFLDKQISADYFASGDFVVFNKPTFDPVKSDTKPEENEVINSGDSIVIRSAKGEIEPFTFSIRSKTDLGSLNISFDDLVKRETGEKISKDDIELYNVKTWLQCQGSTYACKTDPQSQEVAELLVRDNEQDLISDEIGWNGEKYIPPTLNKDFNVNIKANTTYTFYLRIKTPRHTTAGQYETEIKLDSSYISRMGSDFNFNLVLDVLPFELPKSEKDHIVYLNQDLTLNTERTLDKKNYVKYLDLLAESQVNGIVAYEYNELDWQLKQLAERGFDKYIQFFPTLSLEEITDDMIKNVNIKAAAYGINAYIYTKDEPWTEERMIDNLLRNEKIHSLNGKSVTANSIECAQAMADPNFPVYQKIDVSAPQRLDLHIYGLVENRRQCINWLPSDYLSIRDYIKALKREKISERELFYQMIWYDNNPHYNRVVYGLFADNSGLDGAAGYGLLSHYKNVQGKFYDDFDTNRKSPGSIYPSTQGPVLTLQWEAFREGIDDSRYVAKLKDVINSYKDKEPSKAAKASEALGEILSQYSFYGMDGINPWHPIKISDSVHQNNRYNIADLILSFSEFDYITEILTRQGFNGLVPPHGSVSEISAGTDSEFDDNVMILFFDSSRGNWAIHNLNELILIPDVGYYAYSKKQGVLYIRPRSDTQEVTKQVLHKGWNLLANSQNVERLLSNFVVKYDNKIYSLDQLLAAKLAYKKIYLIENETATTAEDAFREIDALDTKLVKIPAKKMFWFYIW